MEVSSTLPNKYGRIFNNFSKMSKGIDKQGVAARIKEIQEKLKINSRSFAISIGMDPSQLSKIEKGALGISSTYATKINELYGVNVTWILNGKGDKGMWKNIPNSFAVTKDKDDSVGEIEERLLRIEAHLEVFENAIAGLLADSKKEDFFKTVAELRETVQGVAKRRLGELKQKSSGI
jgi:transcriptional regulator with XRE-family HTH domain